MKKKKQDDALVMAAAPDLLAALEAFVKADDNTLDQTLDARQVYKAYVDAIDKARAAIAKARGKP